MLIAITQDPQVIEWIHHPASGAAAWGRIQILSAHSEYTATAQMRAYLRMVGLNEPLCIRGHGHDAMMGDIQDDTGAWGWTYEQMAALLSGMTYGYHGNILMEICSKNITDYVAPLVASLEKKEALHHAWVYGHHQCVRMMDGFADPLSLNKNVRLTSQQVWTSTSFITHQGAMPAFSPTITLDV